MAEPAGSSVSPEWVSPGSTRAGSGAGWQSRLQALRHAGAHLRDPIRFAYLENVLRRMVAAPDPVAQVLHRRLDQALTDAEVRWLSSNGLLSDGAAGLVALQQVPEVPGDAVADAGTLERVEGESRTETNRTAGPVKAFAAVFARRRAGRPPKVAERTAAAGGSTTVQALAELNAYLAKASRQAGEAQVLESGGPDLSAGHVSGTRISANTQFSHVNMARSDAVSLPALAVPPSEGEPGQASPDTAARGAARSAIQTAFRQAPALTADESSGRQQGSPLHMSQAPMGLKSARHMGDSWARLQTARRVDQAIRQAPDNAGPFNPHMLVARALMAMGDLSPAYLHYFVLRVDAMLQLEQAAARQSAPARKPKGTSKAEVGQTSGTVS